MPKKDKDTTRIVVSVPADKADEYRQLIERKRLMDDEKGKIVLEMLEKHRGMDFTELSWLLERDYHIDRKPHRLKKIAERVGLIEKK